MNVSKEDIDFWDSHNDERYRKIEDCDDIQKDTAKTLANDDKRIELIAADVKIFKKLGWVIATATVGQLIATIFANLF